MRARSIDNNPKSNFTRGGDPYQKLKIGGSRSLEVLVNERIVATKSDAWPDYNDIRDFVKGNWSDHEDEDVKKMVDAILKHTSINEDGLKMIADVAYHALSGNAITLTARTVKIVHLIDTALKYTPVEYRVQWWVDWHPGENR